MHINEYFQSFDKKFRITLDSQLKYFLPSSKYFLQKPYAIHQKLSILELKYDKIHEDKAYYISSFIPFRMSKFSKYIVGMNLIN